MNQKEQEQRGVELISDRVDPLLFEYDAGSFKAYDEDLDLVLRSRGHRGLNISHAKGVTVPMSRVMSHFRQSSENKDRTLDADSKKVSTPVTGDQAIEFFGRQQDSMDVRVLFLVRTAASLHFRPYDLLVVDRKELEPEHFTMSTSGVVHVRPGFPSQFIPIGQWWRRRQISTHFIPSHFSKLIIQQKCISCGTRMCVFARTRKSGGGSLEHSSWQSVRFVQPYWS
jgi:hypothetical protein